VNDPHEDSIEAEERRRMERKLSPPTECEARFDNAKDGDEVQRAIVAFGNLWDGFTFFGPFEDMEEAVGFAENNLDAGTWSVGVVSDPREKQSEVSGG